MVNAYIGRSLYHQALKIKDYKAELKELEPGNPLLEYDIDNHPRPFYDDFLTAPELEILHAASCETRVLIILRDTAMSRYLEQLQATVKKTQNTSTPKVIKCKTK